MRVAVAGDFNVYPRPDDPFAPGHPLFPSDQLAGLYEQGLENLWDVLVDEVPSSAYSYIFQGQTQTLDQIFATPSMQEDLTTVRSAHVNADRPADFDGDGARGASDHDPMVAVYCRDTTGPALSATAAPNVLWPPNHKYGRVEASISISDDADPDPVVTFVSAVSNEPDNGPDDGNTTNDVCHRGRRHVPTPRRALEQRLGPGLHVDVRGRGFPWELDRVDGDGQGAPWSCDRGASERPRFEPGT